MKKRGIQALIVYGDTSLANPDLTYVAGVLPRGGVYFKQVEHEPLLIVSNLDLGTARRSRKVGRVETLTEWGFERLVANYGRRDAQSRLLLTIIEKEGIKDRIALYGRNDIATGLYLGDYLRRLGANVIGDPSPTILEVARETKNPGEIDEIRKVGKMTARVVESVFEAIRNMRRRRGHLQLNGKRATVGLIKKLIASKMAEVGLIAPEGTIFAIGASSADPHNKGVASDVIKEGRLIVFDIFPQAETGYWFDLTRSFVLGGADSRAKRLFDAVLEAQTASLDHLRENITGDEAMSRACDVIEQHGYQTVRAIFQGKMKSISSGFIHSLGHGVGLTIGERPYLSFLSKEPLRERSVVTVEPGIYLPHFGGVRIEDTVAITARGTESLATVEKEFELT